MYTLSGELKRLIFLFLKKILYLPYSWLTRIKKWGDMFGLKWDWLELWTYNPWWSSWLYDQKIKKVRLPLSDMFLFFLLTDTWSVRRSHVFVITPLDQLGKHQSQKPDLSSETNRDRDLKVHWLLEIIEHTRMSEEEHVDIETTCWRVNDDSDLSSETNFIFQKCI